MFKKEAEWIGTEIINISKLTDKNLLLNVGSSTKHFREVEQPHIQKMIFDRLNETNIKVTHLDIKNNEGVDIVGDLTDDKFLNEIKKNKYNLILCSNLLEHVSHPTKVCDAMLECVEPEGYLIITVPKLYPYHNDPIDTMFRPAPEDLCTYFKDTEVIKKEIVTIELTHFKLLTSNFKQLIIFLIRTISPFYKFNNWKKIVDGYSTLFKKFEISCVVLKKLK